MMAIQRISAGSSDPSPQQSDGENGVVLDTDETDEKSNTRLGLKHGHHPGASDEVCLLGCAHLHIGFLPYYQGTILADRKRPKVWAVARFPATSMTVTSSINTPSLISYPALQQVSCIDFCIFLLLAQMFDYPPFISLTATRRQ